MTNPQFEMAKLYTEEEFYANPEWKALLAEDHVRIHSLGEPIVVMDAYWIDQYCRNGELGTEAEFKERHPTWYSLTAYDLRKYTVLLVAQFEIPMGTELSGEMKYSFHVGLDTSSKSFVEDVRTQLIQADKDRKTETEDRTERLKLNHFYTLKEFFELPQALPILEWHEVLDLYLPTELYIDKPGFQIPQVARAFTTSHYWDGEQIVTYSEIRVKRTKETGDFFGTAPEKSVMLFEYYTCNGSDGHLDYHHHGYIFAHHILMSDSMYPKDALDDLFTPEDYERLK